MSTLDPLMPSRGQTPRDIDPEYSETEKLKNYRKVRQNKTRGDSTSSSRIWSTPVQIISLILVGCSSAIGHLLCKSEMDTASAVY